MIEVRTRGGGDIYKLGWRKAMGAKTESLAIRDGNDFFFPGLSSIISFYSWRDGG